MTAREFVDTIAVPTVQEFQAEGSQRRGYLACLAVFHVADYLKPAGDRYADAVHTAMQGHVGPAFAALQRMANAIKHRESEKGGVILMQAGSDDARPVTGFDTAEFGGSMNPGEGRRGNPLRFDDHGGRYVEYDGLNFDMLDLCVIALRAYAELYPADLAGSAIGNLHYRPAEYPR